MEANSLDQTGGTGDGKGGQEKVSKVLTELRLVVVGWRWPGKSLTANTILGREEFRLERAAEFCVTRQTEAQGRQVTVVDTPGWYSTQTTPLSYKKEITRGATLCPPGPHAFLLVIPVGMFTEVDRARIEEHVGLFGERVWRHTLVVFTWAEVLRKISIERYIRREGAELQWVLEKCKHRYFVIDNCVFEEQAQVGRLMEKVEKMVADEGGHYVPDQEEADPPPTPLDENQNPTRDARELGAKPKLASDVTLPQEVAPLSTE
ncbi:GTPase IMAP family member 4 [Entelurus aequoreus]|uniref:GTPase IMAP family member 4 n=1 Tax=Entelurus aequoreus TaxID=161455 RepID=UPI002B1E03EE|nr:GTPase IMAP family member 4 [Entelurus aequoreus]